MSHPPKSSAAPNSPPDAGAGTGAKSLHETAQPGLAPRSAAQPGPARAESAQEAALKRLLAEREAELAAIETSELWRITRPLVRTLNRFPQLRLGLRWLFWRVAGRHGAPEAPGAAGAADGAPRTQPPAANAVAVVPFGYTAAPITPAPSVAVICHLYYAELAEEVRAYLAHLPFPFDLCLSTDTDEKARHLRAAFGADGATARLPHMRRIDIHVVENRGRDIAPKLLAFGAAHASHEYVLHLHGKRSLHAGRQLEDWRHFVYDSLLGSEQVVRSIFAAFERDPGLGMVGPDHLEILRHVLGWSRNFTRAEGLARRMDLDLRADGPLDFPSGSMFWARSAALRPLLDSGLSWRDFENEGGQIDGTTAHALERLYFFSCELAGFGWMKVVERARRGMQIGEAVEIGSPQAFDAFRHRHGARLIERPAHGGRARSAASPAPRDADAQLTRAWTLSGRRDLGYEAFAREVARLRGGQENALDFDEAFYLAAHPDVAAMVADGQFACGYVQFCCEGQGQGRLWSSLAGRRRFGQDASLGSGLTRATSLRTRAPHTASLAHLPLAERPFLLVQFNYMRADLVFAGLNELLRELPALLARHGRVMVSVEDADFDPGLVWAHAPGVEVVHVSELRRLTGRPHLVLSTSSQLTLQAIREFGDAGRVVYYCQEFESGFFPLGAQFAMAEQAVHDAGALVVSTRPLEDFLRARGLIHAQPVCRRAPAIAPVALAPGRQRRLFCYFRPEFFNTRNMPEAVLEAVEHFCARNEGYEIYLAGTVATSYSYTLGNNQVFVLSKLERARYEELLGSCDAAVALIYSAHPGVIAYQAAASGIPTVTNVFGNRDSAWLREVSDNLVAYDPVRDALVDKVEEALARPRGRPSFNPLPYTGAPDIPLADFLDQMRARLEAGAA